MKRLISSFIVICAVAATFAVVFSKNETHSLELASLDQAPSSGRSFTSLKLPHLPAADQFPPLASAEEVEAFLTPYHERATQGWNPSYSVFIPAFDSKNRPYFRHHNRVQNIPLTNGFQSFDQGHVTTKDISSDIFKSLYPSETADKIQQSIQDILWDPKLAVFDQKDQMYTVVRMRKNIAKNPSYILLFSKDHGDHWNALPLVGTATTDCLFQNIKTMNCQSPELYDLERPYSKDPLPGPPALLYHVSSGKLPSYEKSESWMGTYGRLYLQPLVETSEGGLKADIPVLISDTAEEIGYRSGGAPKVIHSGEKYFITWVEANTSYKPPKDQNGNPITLAPDTSENPYSSIWVAEYNTRTRLLIKREILKSWPVNDTHNQPGILRSSDGILHVISGGHGSHFFSITSLASDSAKEWSSPVVMNLKDTGYKSRYSSPNYPGGSQTYISAMIDSKNQIHTLYRQWVQDRAIFDFDYFGALVYQKGIYDVKTKKIKWEDSRILIYPNAFEYTHWYQLMAMDRDDHLFVEYSNMRPAMPYYFKTAAGVAINISPMLNNGLLKSEDGGNTWFFPTDQDFIQSIHEN